MQELLMAAGTAAVIALLSGPLLIPFLRRLKFGQSIRQEGPQSHLVKAGTPTMGGVIMVLALTVATLLFCRSLEIWVALFVTLGYGLIGFLDDFIKVVLKRNLGLKAREKLLGQILIAAGLAYFSAAYMQRGTDIWIPFWGQNFDLGFAYYILIFFVLVGTTNGVNLTDGLDGLAAGVTTVAAVAYTVVSAVFSRPDLALFCAALAGACVGFLKYNAYPAKIFMGDTGSLALGGALAAVAVMTKTELLLIVIGGIYVIETLSVAIQVASFKSTGRRVFRMAPIHHHFELAGWSEQKVVGIFWLTATVFALLAMLILFMSRTGGVWFL